MNANPTPAAPYNITENDNNKKHLQKRIYATKKKIRKKSLNVFFFFFFFFFFSFFELSEEFPRDSETSSNQP